MLFLLHARTHIQGHNRKSQAKASKSQVPYNTPDQLEIDTIAKHYNKFTLQVQEVSVTLLLYNSFDLHTMSLFFKFYTGCLKVAYGRDPKVEKSNFYDLVDKNMQGGDVPMSDFEGSVILVTNVASK